MYLTRIAGIETGSISTRSIPPSHDVSYPHSGNWNRIIDSNRNFTQKMYLTRIAGIETSRAETAKTSKAGCILPA